MHSRHRRGSDPPQNAVTEPRNPKGLAGHGQTSQLSAQQGFVHLLPQHPPHITLSRAVFCQLLHLQGSGSFLLPPPPEAGGFPSLCPLKGASNLSGFPLGAVWPLSRGFTPSEKPCACGFCLSKLWRGAEGSVRGSPAPFLPPRVLQIPSNPSSFRAQGELGTLKPHKRTP